MLETLLLPSPNHEPSPAAMTRSEPIDSERAELLETFTAAKRKRLGLGQREVSVSDLPENMRRILAKRGRGAKFTR